MSENKTQELKIFDVTNKDTGERLVVVGVNHMDCCRQLGWKIDDCFIAEQMPRRKTNGDGHSNLLVRIPCQVCPFQYAECRKLDAELCPTQPNVPELQEWLKQAAESHLCNYVGQGLYTIDYHLGQKWCSMEQAIEELGDHHRP